MRFYTSVDTGSYIASHWHDTVEIIYLLEGELMITVENSSFRISAGQCVMITPNQIHSTLCTRPNRAIVFQIPVAFMEKFIPDVKQMQFTFHDPAETRMIRSHIFWNAMALQTTNCSAACSANVSDARRRSCGMEVFLRPDCSKNIPGFLPQVLDKFSC